MKFLLVAWGNSLGGSGIQGKRLDFSETSASEHAERVGSALGGELGGKSVFHRERAPGCLCVFSESAASAALIPLSATLVSSRWGGSVTCCWDGLGTDLNQGNPTDCLLQPSLDGMSQHSYLMEGTGYLWLTDGPAALQSRDHVAEVERS